MRTLLASIFVAMLLIACAPSESAPTPSAPVDTPAAAPVPGKTTTVEATAQPTSKTPNPKVVAILDRYSRVKSFSFQLADLPDMRGSHEYFVMGDKIRIDPVKQLLDVGDIDVIFLDTTKKTAKAYCIDSSGCDTPNDAIAVDYDKYSIVLPPEWMTQIKYGEITGTQSFYNRKVQKVVYEANGKYYEAYLDDYFGMPLRIAIATDPGIKNIVGGFEYRQPAFNGLEETDVIHVDE